MDVLFSLQVVTCPSVRQELLWVVYQINCVRSPGTTLLGRDPAACWHEHSATRVRRYFCAQGTLLSYLGNKSKGHSFPRVCSMLYL